jgi:hypothetical protein
MTALYSAFLAMKLAVIVLPIAGAVASILCFSNYRVLGALGFLVCVVLEIQHIVLYRIYMSNYNPDTASHIEVHLYFLAALGETLFLFAILLAATRAFICRAARDSGSNAAV